MTYAVSTVGASFDTPPAVFDEETKMAIFRYLQQQASFMAAIEHTAARAVETGDPSAYEDIERMAGGVKDGLRVLAHIVIEVEISLSLIKD